jgi:clan AA aspartic protease (TIGR02281 family)
MRQPLTPGTPILIRIRVFGPKGQREIDATFDTGAAYVTISRRDAADIGFDLRSAPTVKVSGATGTARAPKILLPRVSLGELDASDVPALCLDLPAGLRSALIGMNLISRFNVALDATHRELRITAP